MQNIIYGFILGMGTCFTLVMNILCGKITVVKIKKLLYIIFNE